MESTGGNSSCARAGHKNPLIESLNRRTQRVPVKREPEIGTKDGGFTYIGNNQ